MRVGLFSLVACLLPAILIHPSIHPPTTNTPTPTLTPPIDIRKPSTTVAELGEHQAPVNAVAWAPHSACHLCTCGDDRQALIWDLR